jgi:hypothetical protein
MKYSEKECGLVTKIGMLMNHLAKFFLNEAFSGKNLVHLISDSEWIGVWERQPLSFSSAVTMNASERLLV